VLLIGLVSDMISGSRKLLEDLLYRIRVLELTGRDAHDRAAEPATMDRK
jgi:hypothetical protein